MGKTESMRSKTGDSFKPRRMISFETNTKIDVFDGTPHPGLHGYSAHFTSSPIREGQKDNRRRTVVASGYGFPFFVAHLITYKEMDVAPKRWHS